MFSTMALSAHVLDRLPVELRKNGLLLTAQQLQANSAARRPTLDTQNRYTSNPCVPSLQAEPHAPALRDLEMNQERLFEQVLLEGQWPAGKVCELSLQGQLSGATSLALAACRHAQLQTDGSQEEPWCAFIDPSRTLHAPGVARAGVALKRLLILRPEPEDMSRVLLRLALSRALRLIVVDLVGSPNCPLSPRQAEWTRVVRRLGPELSQTEGRVLLLTSQSAFQASPLPVSLRIELSRPEPGRLSYQVSRHVGGRLSPRRLLPFVPSTTTSTLRPPRSTSTFPRTQQSAEGSSHVA